MKNLIRKYLGVDRLLRRLELVEKTSVAHVKSIIFMLRKLSVSPTEYVAGRDDRDGHADYIRETSKIELNKALSKEKDLVKRGGINRLLKRIEDGEVTFEFPEDN